MQQVLQSLIPSLGLLAPWLVALLALGFSVLSWWKTSQAQPTTQAGAPSGSTVQTPKRSNLNLNMGIAHTYQIANQLVGMQLSGGNVLAQVVSACSIVAGTVSLAVVSLPGAWLFWIVAGGVGFGLAYLIEGLTLSSLMKIRLTDKQIKEIEAGFTKERDDLLHNIARPQPQADLKAYKTARKVYQLAIKDIEQEFRRKRNHAVGSLRKNRSTAIIIAFGGATASAVGGGIFYHAVFSSLGMASYAISALLALVVTGTFVSNELHKEMQEQAIREGFAGGSLFDAALTVDTRRLSNQIVHEGILTHLQSEEAQEELKATSLAILKDIISTLRPAFQESTNEAVIISEERQIPRMLNLPQAESREGTTTSTSPAPTTNVQTESPITPTQEDEQKREAEPSRITRDDLGMVEGIMYDKVTENQEILAALQKIAQSTDLPGLVAYLKQQYSSYASYITEARVSRVMTAIQQEYKAEASPAITHKAQDQPQPDQVTQKAEASAPIDSEVPQVTPAQKEERQDPQQERTTDAIHAVPKSSEQAPSDSASEMTDILAAYPMITKEWLAKGTKSVSVEEIIAATGLSRQKVQYHARNTLARTPKNPEKYTVASVLKWLKTMPKPAVKNIEPAPETPSANGHQNGHHTGSTQEDLHVEAHEAGVN